MEARWLSARELSLTSKRGGKTPLSETTVKSILNGTIPKVDTLKAIADTLGCTVNDLIGDGTLGNGSSAPPTGDALSFEEESLVRKYRLLHGRDRQVLSLMCDAFTLQQSAPVPAPRRAKGGR